MEKKIPKVIFLLLIISILFGVISVFIVRPKLFHSENLTHLKAYLIFGTDFHKIKNWESIKIGMTDKEVIKVLGEPELIDKKLEIIQYHGDPNLYNKRIPNPNKAFWYFTGVDNAALYIFNKENKVVFINIGGT